MEKCQVIEVDFGYEEREIIRILKSIERAMKKGKVNLDNMGMIMIQIYADDRLGKVFGQMLYDGVIIMA